VHNHEGGLRERKMETKREGGTEALRESTNHQTGRATHAEREKEETDRQVER